MAAASHIRAVLAVALMGLAVLAVQPAAREEAPALVATAAGDLRLASSAADQAILDADGLRPGDSTSGSLTISNRSTAEQRLRLKTVGVTDTPGPGGGVLSGHLRLVVERTTGTKTHEVFSGTVVDLSEIDLGALPSSQSQVYSFTATVPEYGPAVDDAYAGATVEVGWRWEATEEESVAKEPQPDLEPELGGDAPAAVPPARGTGTTATPRAEEPPAREGRAIGDEEGPAPAAGGSVRLWSAAPPVQRLRTGRKGRPSLAVLVRCRPACSVSASTKVKVGRRWIVLRARRLGTATRQSDAVRLTFRLSGAEARRIRRALAKHRRLPVRIVLRAAAPGHARAQRTLALRLQK